MKVEEESGLKLIRVIERGHVVPFNQQPVVDVIKL